MATHTIVNNQLTYSPISTQADAIRAAIGAAKMSVSDSAPVNSRQAFAYGGSPSNKICYLAKQYGTAGNGITVTGSYGPSITATVNGNAVSITAPDDTDSRTVAAVVNAVVGIPITMEPELCSNLSANALYTYKSFSAITLAYGVNGTSGTLGDRILYQSPAGQYVTYECVSGNPVKWKPIGSAVFERKTDADITASNLIVLRAGDCFDKFIYVDSPSVTEINLNIPTNLNICEGQTVTVVSTKDVSYAYFGTDTRNEGDAPVSLTRNYAYSCICVDDRGSGRWLHI